MTKGFFDYEGRDDDEPRTYYDSRVAKAKRDGTWHTPGAMERTLWWVPGMPKGAMTATSRRSLWHAILYSVMSVGWLYFAIMGWDDDGSIVRLGLGLVSAPVCFLWWRSYRVVKRWEQQRAEQH